MLPLQSGDFEQLLLTCIEGCGLQRNKFKVHDAACALYYILLKQLRALRM